MAASARDNSGDEAGKEDEEELLVQKERMKQEEKEIYKWPPSVHRGAIPGGEKARGKGWSDEGMIVFEKYVWRQSAKTCWITSMWFGRRPRNVMEKLGHTKQDDGEQKARYKPNLEVVYEDFD